MKKIILLFIVFCTYALVYAAEKPNIIIIYTDDQGAGDVSALNPEAKFQTPNLDKMVKEGIAFTHGHSSNSICTPSRYGLLTGRYSWRTVLKRGVMQSDEEKCLIPDSRMTLASLLKQHDYHTGMVGKWHLGMQVHGESYKDRDWSKPIKDMPLDKGFDYFYGVPASLNYGVLAWFEGRYAKVPPTLLTSKKNNDRHNDYRMMPPFYDTEEKVLADPKKQSDKIIEVAPDFIDNQCLTRFTDKAIDWMTTKVDDAKKGKPFFLYLPYTSPHYPVCPLPQFKGQGNCGAYGEFLIETDYHVGRIFSFLKESGIDENTLVIFTSDNGPENPWADHIEQYGHDSKAGFTDGKRAVYEGGHRVPFIVRWPKGIKNEGRTWDAPVSQLDLMATFADILDYRLPDNAGEDSQSFKPVLNNESYQREPLISVGNSAKDRRYAITHGDWKLLLPAAKMTKKQIKKGKDTTIPELYNLTDDPKESKNLAMEKPELVKELTEKISDIVLKGRTTAGKAQKNDTEYWTELTWITPADYEARHGK